MTDGLDEDKPSNDMSNGEVKKRSSQQSADSGVTDTSIGSLGSLGSSDPNTVECGQWTLQSM